MSKSSPDITNRVSVSRQLAMGIPFPLPKTRITSDLSSPLSICIGSGDLNSGPLASVASTLIIESSLLRLEL